MTPQPGDILQHPVFGTFRVYELDDRRIIGGRGEQRFSIPLAALNHARSARGVLALAAVAPHELKASLIEDPLGSLAGLMEEVECTRSSSEALLTGMGVMDPLEFADWWRLIVEKLENDSRFVLTDERIHWREAPNPEELEEKPGKKALSAPGTLAVDELIPFSLMLAKEVAALHSRHQHPILERSRIFQEGSQLQLEAVSTGDKQQDLQKLLLLSLEQVVGILPPELAPHELAFQILGVQRALPVEWLGVALEVLGGAGSGRIEDALELVVWLERARAVNRARKQAPVRMEAEVQVGFDTHIGLMKSLNDQTNQDSFVMVGEPKAALVGVADGISLCSVGSGDQASFLATQTLKKLWMANSAQLGRAGSPKAHAFLESALKHANEVICTSSLRQAGGNLDEQSPMGTTFVGALLLGSQAHLAALGDSRAYLVSGELVCPLTYDQNLKSLLLRLHMLGRQVDLSEPGHALVGFLGHFAPDGTPSLPPLFQRTLSLLPGEWLILCSDGLTDYAAPSERELAELLRIETSKTGDENLAMDLARTLVAAANRGGGGDNITVLVITLSRKAQTAARGIGASEDTTKA